MFKFKWIKLAIGVVGLTALTVFTTDHFRLFEVRRLRTQISKLQREKAEMELFARRLSASRRTAQFNVLSQHRAPESDEVVTVLRWQQIASSGVIGPPEIIEIKGTQLYVEAMVIKFDFELVGRSAPNQKTSLAMFRRAFGDQQAPQTGMPLDQIAPPDAGAQRDPQSLQARLWKRFWDLSSDPQLAKGYGVRVAQCEAPSVRIKPGEVWEIRLDAAGGLNLRKMSERLPADSTRPREDQISARD